MLPMREGSTAIKTTLVVMVGVTGFTVIVMLALLMVGLALDRFSGSWIVGALFSSWLLFWSFVLLTGLVPAVVIVVGWRVVNMSGATHKDDGERGDKDGGG